MERRNSSSKCFYCFSFLEREKTPAEKMLLLSLFLEREKEKVKISAKNRRFPPAEETLGDFAEIQAQSENVSATRHGAWANRRCICILQSAVYTREIGVRRRLRFFLVIDGVLGERSLGRFPRRLRFFLVIDDVLGVRAVDEQLPGHFVFDENVLEEEIATRLLRLGFDEDRLADFGRLQIPSLDLHRNAWERGGGRKRQRMREKEALLTRHKWLL